MRVTRLLRWFVLVAVVAVAAGMVAACSCSEPLPATTTTAAAVTPADPTDVSATDTVDSTTGEGDRPSTTADGQAPATESTATESTSTESTAAAAATEGVLPDLVGLDLQLAQDTLQAGGWYGMTSYDASGQNRMQLWDRNWVVVVAQTPAAGETVLYSKIIELGVVKKGEPGSEVLREYEGLPDVVGKNLQLAIDTLQSAGYYLFEYVDAAGKPEIPIVHSNWVVIGQDPPAGTDLATNRMVTLRIEKGGRVGGVVSGCASPSASSRWSNR